MQKIYSLLIFLSIISYGQQGRVGINTDAPEATLDIREKPLDEMPELPKVSAPIWMVNIP